MKYSKINRSDNSSKTKFENVNSIDLQGSNEKLSANLESHREVHIQT